MAATLKVGSLSPGYLQRLAELTAKREIRMQQSKAVARLSAAASELAEANGLDESYPLGVEASWAGVDFGPGDTDENN